MHKIFIMLAFCAPSVFAQELLYTSDETYSKLLELSKQSSTAQNLDVRRTGWQLDRTEKPDPFILETGEQFEFGWCIPDDRNRTLKDLANRLTKESAHARDMAHRYVYTKDTEALRVAYEYMNEWAKKSTVFNGYELDMKPEKATFTGIEAGFCNRSWNMMLDSIWQSYGLMNFSQVYLTLANHKDDIGISEAELVRLKHWLLNSLVPAVNSGFHAWTRWADAHPTSGAYTRYRSDNHLSWCLAGLAAAAQATGAKKLMSYVVFGTEYDDGFSGPYKNPSHLTAFTMLAINDEGEVYDEKVRTSQHKGFSYANFSSWAMLHAYISAKSFYGDNAEVNLERTEERILSAFTHYAKYVSGDVPLSDLKETTTPSYYAFAYRLAEQWLPSKGSLCDAVNSTGHQKILQGLGSTALTTHVCND
ncbi:MAG: hypothetical protein P1U57_01835 [Oleibacter sp.]|nr:hypothetical protein [Thalassolituus sp.]